MSDTVHLRPRAKEDLIDLWSYIADRNGNEPAADRLLRKLEKVFSMLADHPQAGRTRPELQAHLRSFAIGKYVAFYCLVPGGIELIRVLSGYLDVQPEDVN